MSQVAERVSHRARRDPTYVGNFHVRAYVRQFRRFDLAVIAHHRERITVHLRRGTVLEPHGVRLRPRMLVSIDGYFVRGVFLADRITLAP